MRLQREQRSDIESPAWKEVEHALNAINPRDSGFVILVRSDGSYVQCAGARLRLIVEWRAINEDGSFKHVVLGKDRTNREPASINTSAGIIQLQKNEILSVKDALKVFRCFYDNAGMSGSYVARDITQMMLGD